MAKYEVMYSCGHSGVASLFGPTEERERKISWMRESGLCPECYAAKKIASRESEVAAAQERVAAFNLKELVGSEKQIAWAESIRAKALADCQELIEKMRIVVASKPEHAAQGEKMEQVTARFLQQESAKWWIDHRNIRTRQLLLEGCTEEERAQLAGK